MLDFDINWLAVLAAAVAAFVIGSLWYSSVLFGKIWQSEVKMSDDDIRSGNMPIIFGSTFIMAAIQATLFAAAVAGLLGADPSFGDVILFSAVIGIAWVATSFATGYLFERRTMTLWLINAGYNVVLFLAFGVIIGLWK